jgi:hypothetical protein
VWTLRIPFEGQIRFKASFLEAALGVMDRLVLSNAAWERMAPLIIGRCAVIVMPPGHEIAIGDSLPGLHRRRDLLAANRFSA